MPRSQPLTEPPPIPETIMANEKNRQHDEEQKKRTNKDGNVSIGRTNIKVHSGIKKLELLSKDNGITTHEVNSDNRIMNNDNDDHNENENENDDENDKNDDEDRACQHSDSTIDSEEG